MEQNLSIREEMPRQASGFIEQAACRIYEAHSHEIITILFAAVSLIFGYGAYQEYGLVTRTVDEEEA